MPLSTFKIGQLRIMKFITLFVLLSFNLLKLSLCSVENEERINLSSYENSTITDYTLKQLLYKFKQMVGKYQVMPDQHILINQTEIFLNASLTKGCITDPSSFKIVISHVNMLTLEFFVGVSYSELIIDGGYSLYLDNEYIHMKSSDNLSVNTSDMAVNVYLKLNLTKDQTLQIENFILDYNMTMKVDIKNLGGSVRVSHSLNKLINDMIPDLVQFTKPDVQRIASSFVFQKSQFLLGGMTLQQFLDLINNIINS